MKSGKRAPPKQKQPRRPRRVRKALPECAVKYIHARVDPFSLAAVGACVPGSSAVPSFKMQTRGMYNLAVLAPTGMAIGWTPCLANNLSEFWYNAATPTTAYSTWMATAGSAASTGSPFTSSQFGIGNLEHRVVGGAIRIRPTNSMYVKQGAQWGYWTPAGTVQAISATGDGIQKYYNTKHKIASEGDGALFVCIDHEDSETFDQYFSGTAYYLGTAAPSNGTGQPFLGYIQPGTDGYVQCLVETVCHWEVRGRTVASFSTPNQPYTEFGSLFSGVSDVLRIGGSIVYGSAQMLRMVNSYLNGDRGANRMMWRDGWHQAAEAVD